MTFLGLILLVSFRQAGSFNVNNYVIISAINLMCRASVIEPIISSGSQKSVAPHLPTVHDFIHTRIS